MNLTYFVMIEMLEATHSHRGKIVGHVQSFINAEDYLSSDNQDSDRLFYNENAAKGISECLEKYGESLKLSAKIVGIPEDAGIFDYEDAAIDEFLDVIDIYPGVDPRYNAATGEFARKSSSDDEQIKFEASPVIFEKAAAIVKDLRLQHAEEDMNEALDESLIRELLPNRQTLHDIVNASLEIEDENEFSEVIISQSETSLAIMQTLMSDDLADVDDVDIEEINARIFPKIKASESAKDYILASRILSQFIDEVKSTENEIRGQYQRDLDAYLDKVIKEIELEYRSKVPDLTEENVNNYYESIAPLFTDRSNEKARTKDRLQTEIINEFVAADRSPVLKSLRKFLVLKEQIRQSAIAAILRVKTREDQKAQAAQAAQFIHPMQYADPQFTRSFESMDLGAVKPVEPQRSEPIAPIVEETQIEEVVNDESINENVEEVEGSKESEGAVEKNVEEAPTVEIEEQPKESEEHVKESAEEFDDITDDEDKEYEMQPIDFDNAISDDEDEMILDKKVAVSTVDISSLIEEDEDETEDKDDADIDENQDNFEEDVDLEEDEESLDDRKSRRKERVRARDRHEKKKMGILGKIGLSLLGVTAAGAITFGTLYVVKGPHSSNNEVKTEQTQSKTIGDTVFNVGDTLTIVGQDGQSLDVKLKEFKEDGSAVANDANGDLWLITGEQMKQYADKHPDLFKKTDKKDSKDNKQSSEKKDDKSNNTNKDSKDNKQSSEKKDDKSNNTNKDSKDNKQSANNQQSADKKDEKKSGN